MNKSPPKHVFDITIFEDRLKYMNKALTLLNILVQAKDSFNRVTAKKYDIAKLVAKNPRTVAGWLRLLSLNGAIKYKYSGDIMVNPYFAFDGSDEEYEKTTLDWAKFRSDTPALKPEYTKPA